MDRSNGCGRTREDDGIIIITIKHGQHEVFKKQKNRQHN